MDRALEEFGVEAGNLSHPWAGGGSGLFVGRGGAGAFSDADADVREVYGLPGADLLPDVESFPHPAGGDAGAGGRDIGRVVNGAVRCFLRRGAGGGDRQGNGGSGGCEGARGI